MATAKKSASKQPSPQADAVLVRMLNTPPTPFTPPAKKAKAKPQKGR